MLFFWTGTHNDYHKPSDTFDKINYDDEARILSLVRASSETLIARQTFDLSRRRRASHAARLVDSVFTSERFQTTPTVLTGLLIDGVREDSPAAKAGIKAGDRIVKIGTREVKNVYDYTYALGRNESRSGVCI